MNKEVIEITNRDIGVLLRYINRIREIQEPLPLDSITRSKLDKLVEEIQLDIDTCRAFLLG